MKINILEDEKNNTKKSQRNIIEKQELELSAKNQHIVVYKRDQLAIKEKYDLISIEKDERGLEVDKLYKKVNEFVDTNKRNEEENKNTMEELELRFKGILENKNEKIGGLKEEVMRLRKELKIVNQVINGNV